LSKEHE